MTAPARISVVERMLITDNASPETLLTVGRLSATNNAWDRQCDRLLAEVRRAYPKEGR